jgi:hypothetical protein
MNTLKSIFAAFGFLAASNLTYAAPIHLGSPEFYDNAGLGSPFGQTFIAEDLSFLGITFYIGDPTRPGELSVDALTGDADLVLYEATDLSSPVELERRRVQSGSTSTFGITTFTFSRQVSTVIGTRYFAAIDALDGFGLGLRSATSSYPGGSEAAKVGTVIQEIGGRDTAFAVIAVPEPGSVSLVVLGLVAAALSGNRLARRVKCEDA